MTTSAINKQVYNYLQLLTTKQQALVLEMIKSLLNVDSEPIRITRNEYNKELDEAIARIENGNYVSHKDALEELSKF
jgi:vacuolar-type H+-ATPase subunit D/Vma8